MLLSRIIPMLILVLCLACSKEDDEKDSDSDSGTLEIDLINEVTAVTDPVAEFNASATSDSATEARNFDNLEISSFSALASTGVSLGSSTADIASSFSDAQNGSAAFCDTVNAGMKFFQETGSPDFNICILKATSSTQNVKMKQDEYQIWDLKGEFEGEALHIRYKFKIATDDDGNVKSFETFICEDEGDGLAQTNYMTQAIDGTSIEVNGRSKGEDDFLLKVRMTAERNSEGGLVGLKEIDYSETSAGSQGGTRVVHGAVTQSKNNIRYIGYEKVGQRLVEYYSFSELLNHNAEDEDFHVTKLAYGDGAAFVRRTNTGSGDGSHTHGWDGDSLSLDNSSSRLSKVENKTDELLDSDESLDLDFPAAAQWDCSDAPEETFGIDDSEVITACLDRYEIDQNGSTMCNGVSY